MFRYGDIDNGKFTGGIRHDDNEWPLHVRQKMKDVARLIVSIDPVPDRPEYYVKLPPVYEAGELEIREIFAYEIHPMLKEIKKDELARIRWERETAGIVLNGVRVDTSRDSQTMIDSAVGFAEKVPPETIIDFKAASGWISLDAATICDIGLAVGWRVQKSYSLERRYSEQIDALADQPEALMALDLMEGWPE